MVIPNRFQKIFGHNKKVGLFFLCLYVQMFLTGHSYVKMLTLFNQTILEFRCTHTEQCHLWRKILDLWLQS